MRPTPRPALPEDTFTPGQQTGLQYSRDRMADGSYLTNPDGGVTSFMGAIDQDPSGQEMNYPTFWDGKVLDRKEALRRAFEYEEKTGKKFARYPTVEAAIAGEKAVHGVMEQDAAKIPARRRK